MPIIVPRTNPARTFAVGAAMRKYRPEVPADEGYMWVMLNMFPVGARGLLVAGMIVGLVIGLFQALTQIQEQTVAFVPKIIVMLLVLSVSLPWLIAQMLQYTTSLIAGIPGRF